MGGLDTLTATAATAGNLSPDVPDAVGAALRDARHQQGWSLRAVERIALQLSEQNPRLYTPLSRGMVNAAERLGGEYIATNKDVSKIRTLLTVLFGGVEQFETATDMKVPHLRRRQASGRVPVVQEGQQDVRDSMLYRGGKRLPEVPTTLPCDYLVQVTSYDMAPVLYPDQYVGVQRATQADLGKMAVVRTANRVRLAWTLANGHFAVINVPNNGVRTSFKLTGEDTVLGYVVWVQPQLPLPSNA